MYLYCYRHGLLRSKLTLFVFWHCRNHRLSISYPFEAFWSCISILLSTWIIENLYYFIRVVRLFCVSTRLLKEAGYGKMGAENTQDIRAQWNSPSALDPWNWASQFKRLRRIYTVSAVMLYWLFLFNFSFLSYYFKALHDWNKKSCAMTVVLFQEDS